MELGLTNWVVLVSGGGSGIGAAITRLCLAEGARVLVAGRETPAVAEFAQSMAANERCAFFYAELGEPAACSQAVEQATSRWGRLDGLVNNAGANDNVGLAHGDPSRFEQSLRANLLHYYSLAHYALPWLSAAHGAIVNIASKVAVTGQGNTSAYAAAKGAQLALTREWAVELAPAGVRVNAVLPAEVLTPLYKEWLARQGEALALAEIESRIPLAHRMTTPEEIAAAAVFLLSPTQSGHTTGQHVFVDGGYTHLDRAISPAARAQ